MGEWRPVSSMWHGSNQVHRPEAANGAVIWIEPPGLMQPVRVTPGDIFPADDTGVPGGEGWEFI